MIIILLTCLFPYILSLKVLVHSPAFAASHTNYMARLADTLTEAGHNVTFFMPIFDEVRKNQLGVKVTKDVVLLEPNKNHKKITIDKITGKFWTIDVTSKNGRILYETFYHQVLQNCENIFQNQEIVRDLKSREFDVGIAEPLMTSGLALFRHIGIEKVVIASSCPNYDHVIEAMGEPADTSYVPAVVSGVSGDRMSFAERLENHDIYQLMIEINTEMFDDEARIFRKYLGEEFPDWRTLIPDASLHFTNSISFLDFPRPAFQKTINIGGISVDLENIQSEKLPKTWDQILNKRPKNMFLSFGSLAKSSEMPEDYKKNLIRVFQSMPDVTFIWKYESDDVDFARGLENLEFVKWAPQTALLNDPRLTAFLGHGGLGSTFESSLLGKPSIMVPIFFDQTRNSNMLSRLNMTITLHKSDLGDYTKLPNAFHEILHNANYRLNALKVAESIRNQPVYRIRWENFQMDPSQQSANEESNILTHLLMLIAGRTRPIAKLEMIKSFREAFPGKRKGILSKLPLIADKYMVDEDNDLDSRIQMCFVGRFKVPEGLEKEMLAQGVLTKDKDGRIERFTSMNPAISSFRLFPRERSSRKAEEDSGVAQQDSMDLIAAWARSFLQSSSPMDLTDDFTTDDPFGNSSSPTPLPITITPSPECILASHNKQLLLNSKRPLQDDSFSFDDVFYPVSRDNTLKRNLAEIQDDLGIKRSRFDNELTPPKANAYHFLYGVVTWLNSFDNDSLEKFTEKLEKAILAKSEELNEKVINFDKIKSNLEFILDTVTSQKKGEAEDESIDLKEFLEKLEDFAMSFSFVSPSFVVLVKEIQEAMGSLADEVIPAKLVVYSISFLLLEFNLL